MFQEKDDSSNRELRSQCGDEFGIDGWRPQVLESSGHVLQDLDRVVSVSVLAVASVQPRRNGEDDDDEGVAEDRHEKEHAR